MSRQLFIRDENASGALRKLLQPDAAIDLWLCTLDRSESEIVGLERSLSPEERTRADRFGTPGLRSRWIVGRGTLRMLLAQVLGVEATAVRLRRGRRGRPEIDDHHSLDFNVSHTDGVALIGIFAQPQHARIGVDIERVDRVVNADRLAQKFLSARERLRLEPLDQPSRKGQFLRLWTCKEAMSKATGDALSAPFGALDVDLRGEDPAGHPQLIDGPSPYVPADWRLLNAAVPSDFYATVAIWNAPAPD